MEEPHAASRRSFAVISGHLEPIWNSTGFLFAERVLRSADDLERSSTARMQTSPIVKTS
jgi:hypothetical protein